MRIFLSVSLLLLFFTGCAHQGDTCYLAGCWKPMSTPKKEIYGPTCEKPPALDCAKDEVLDCKTNSVGCKSCSCKTISLK